jgi:chemotaxis protein methyltransferase CheR
MALQGSMRRGTRRAPPAGADLEAIEVELFVLGVFRRYGYDLRGYDPEFVRRQIARRMREEGCPTVTRLAEVTLRRPETLERLLAQFSEDEASLFEPAGFWRSFRRNVASYLRTYPSIRVWLAGGRPEEVYSLAILLAEEFPRRVQIYATEIHDRLLERARAGLLTTAAVRRGARDYRRSGGPASLERYFERRNGASVLAPALRERIVFASHNPATDGSFQQCHVVVARRGMESFSPDLRDRACRLLHESLVRLGFLGLAPGDDLRASVLQGSYREVDRAAGLYQKVRE